MASARLWLCVLASLVMAGPAAAQLAPDMIVHNANIHTLDAQNTDAQAVAVRDGVIVAVGSNEDVLRLAAAGTRRIDAGGKTIIPGLLDSHIHLGRLASDLTKVQVRDLTSVGMLLDRIEARAAETPKGQWIITASDWHESQLREHRFPTRRELDEAAPDHPVFIRRGGHNVVINTAAMKLAKIAEDAPDPKGGHYVRDSQGRFTGWILERPAIAPVAKLLPKESLAERKKAMKEAMAALNAVGVTGVRDMHVDSDDVHTWQALVREGAATVRGYLMLTIQPRTPAEADIAKWGSLGISSGFGNDMLRIGGLKITHDGGVETSLLSEDFANKPGFKGTQVTPLEKIRKIAFWACENGWQLGVHTVGDQAIRNVLGVYEEVNRTCPIADKRWALEHPYLLDTASIAKIKALGVVPTMQTGHNYTLGAGWVEFWGKDRANSSIQNRTLIDAGVLPAGGTDAPVTPYSPFLAMWADVTRDTASAGKLGEQEAVTPLEALRMHTIWAARASFDEDRKGSIETGKIADLVVLSEDVLTVPPARIRDVRAEMTILGGTVVYER